MTCQQHAVFDRVEKDNSATILDDRYSGLGYRPFAPLTRSSARPDFGYELASHLARYKKRSGQPSEAVYLPRSVSGQIFGAPGLELRECLRGGRFLEAASQQIASGAELEQQEIPA